MLYGFVFLKLHLHHEGIEPGREWLGFRSISDTIIFGSHGKVCGQFLEQCSLICNRERTR